MQPRASRLDLVFSQVLPQSVTEIEVYFTIRNEDFWGKTQRQTSGVPAHGTARGPKNDVMVGSVSLDCSCKGDVTPVNVLGRFRLTV